MKRIIAILLCLVMALSGLTALAEEVSNEQAFKEGLMNLVNSFAEGDQLDYEFDEMGQPKAKYSLKTASGLYELLLTIPGTVEGLQMQFNEEGVYVAMGAAAFHLAFENIQSIAMALVESVSEFGAANMPPELAAAMQKIDEEVLNEIMEKLAQRLMAGMKVEGSEDGVTYTYEATGKELLETVAAFGDEVFADEKYAETASNAIIAALIVSDGSAEGLPTAEELIAAWPALKEQLLAADTQDFAVALSVFVSNDSTRLDIDGCAGVPADLYLMKWNYLFDQEKGEFTLDGKLTERIQRSADAEATDYDIDIHANLKQSGSIAEYVFTIDYPTAGFALKLNGMSMGPMGKMDLEVTRRNRKFLTGSLNYALSDDGISLDGEVATMRGGTYKASLLASSQHLNVKASQNGRDVFAADLYMDEYGTVTAATVETPAFKAEYDGEKLVITTPDGMTVTCTAAYESPNAFVITMQAEGENVQEGQDKAYIRCEYEGEPHNWNMKTALIIPDGTELYTVTTAVAPGEPLVPIAEAYAETLTEIDAEFVKMLVNNYLQMMQQTQTLGE